MFPWVLADYKCDELGKFRDYCTRIHHKRKDFIKVPTSSHQFFKVYLIYKNLIHQDMQVEIWQASGFDLNITNAFYDLSKMFCFRKRLFKDSGKSALYNRIKALLSFPNPILNLSSKFYNDPQFCFFPFPPQLHFNSFIYLVFI